MARNKSLARHRRPPATSHPTATPLPENAVVQQSVKVTRAQFQGPLPPPDILADYEVIKPGFADRIVAMAEKEQQHRHEIETSVITSSFDEAKRGQAYGLAIGIVAIIAGAGAAIAGAPTPGAIIGGGGVIGLVSVFVLGRIYSTDKPSND